ncbi:MAG: 50S ribosomal protein L24e [Acidilobaceae archaeon]
MPKERTCSYCGKSIEPGTGMMYVTSKGEIFWFCSGKCWKNFSLGRNPAKLGWARRIRARVS